MLNNITKQYKVIIKNETKQYKITILFRDGDFEEITELLKTIDFKHLSYIITDVSDTDRYDYYVRRNFKNELYIQHDNQYLLSEIVSRLETYIETLLLLNKFEDFNNTLLVDNKLTSSLLELQENLNKWNFKALKVLPFEILEELFPNLQEIFNHLCF